MFGDIPFYYSINNRDAMKIYTRENNFNKDDSKTVGIEWGHSIKSLFVVKLLLPVMYPIFFYIPSFLEHVFVAPKGRKDVILVINANFLFIRYSLIKLS